MENVSIIAQIKKRNPAATTGTITIRGFYNRKPVASKSTGHIIQCQHWDSDKRCVKSYAPNASLINTCIEIKLQDMKAQLMKKEIAGHRPNRSAVAKAVRGIDDARDFIKFCQDRIREEYTSKETMRSYLAECTKLEGFRSPISFSDIDYSFLTAYKKYMQDLPNDPNTIWKSFKFVNTMINKAMAVGGIIHETPFESFDRGRYVQKPRSFCELAECDSIENFLLLDDQPILLRRVAVRFLFMCYSGMRFADAMAFDYDLHVQDEQRIRMQYRKFGTEVNNLMWDRLRTVVDTMKDEPLKLSNQKFNQWLKVLAALCGIKKNLTSHIGRHTLGSLLAEMEVPVERAQLILGHRDIRSTTIYYHQKGKNIDAANEKLNALPAPNK